MVEIEFIGRKSKLSGRADVGDFIICNLVRKMDRFCAGINDNLWQKIE